MYFQYSSDTEHRSSKRRPRSAVRFSELVRVDKEHLHGLHQSVRDLSADHERLESELDREIRDRYRHVSLANVILTIIAIPITPSVLSAIFHTCPLILSLFQ